MGKFQAKLSKVTATGGQFSLTHNVAYDKDRFHYPRSVRTRLRLSVRLERESRGRDAAAVVAGRRRAVQPDCRAGRDAGSLQRRDDRPINTDIALADFEASVRNLVSDVEIAYWELYFAVPEPRRGDRRPRQRPVDVAEDLHPLPHRRQGRRGRKRGPGPRAILPLPQHSAEQSLNDLYADRSRSCATCWDWRPPTAG